MQKAEKTETSAELKEIKVINTVETVEVDKLNSDDLKFLFDNCHNELPQIPQFTFDAFYDNQMYLNNVNYLTTIPGVSELILRKIIDCCRFIQSSVRFLSTGQIDRKPFMVVPIIDDLKVDKMPVRKVNIVRSSYSGGESLSINEYIAEHSELLLPEQDKPELVLPELVLPEQDKHGQTGGFVMRPKISKKNLSAIKRTEKNTDLKQVIKLRFDYPVYCVTPTGNTYINPPDEEINIIGLQVMSLNDALIYNDYLTSKMTPDSKLQPPIVSSSINAKLSNGTYTVDEIGSLMCFENLTLDMCFDRKFPLDNGIQKLLSVGYVFIDGKPLPSDIILDKLVDQKIDLNKVLIAIHNYVKDVLMFFRSKDVAALSSVAISNYTRVQTVPPVISMKPDSYVWTPQHEEIIKYMSSKMFPGTEHIIGTNYSISAASELNSIGALELFYEIVLFGKDSKKVKQSMELSTYRTQRQNFVGKLAAAQIETKYQENLVKFMTGFKLGEAKLAQLTLAAKKRNLIGADIVQALDPKDKNIVLDLIAQHNKKLTADRSCPHWALLLRFRRAKTDEQSGELYIKLYDYFKLAASTKQDKTKQDKTKPDWVYCKECSNAIMCPHLRDLTQMTMDRVSPETIKSKMQSYMDDIPNNGNYYCKYCHEILFYGNLINSFMIDSDAKLFGGIADELRTQIWSEVSFIVKTMKTQAIPSVKKLVISIVDYIYDYIFEIEKQLIKSKTNSPDDINNKKKLFINIYALAYIIHLVIYNLNTSKSQAINKDLAFNFKDINVVLKTQTPGQKLTPIQNLTTSDYIKYGILTIISTKNYIISQIANINPEFIKTKFIDAFKIVSSGGPATINYVNQSESIFNVLLSDPIYYYFYKINCIDATQIIQKKSLSDAVDKIDEVLGVKLEKIAPGEYIFAKALVPNFSSPKWKVKEFEELPDFIVEGVSPYKLLDVKADFSSLYSATHKGYVGLSFKLFHEQQTSHIYEKLMYVLNRHNNVVAPEYIAYWAKLDKMLAKENLLLEYKLLLNMRTAQSFGALQYYEDLRTKKNAKHWQAPSRCYQARKVSIGYLFDESGRRHNFDIYVFASGQMLNSKEIAAKVVTGAWTFAHAVDKKCSVCGQLQSAVHILSEEKIKMAIKANNTVENFFKYYKNRCPVNSLLHDWQNDSCRTCKITYSMFKAPSSPESMKYYTEFAKVYQDDLKKASEAETQVAEIVKAAPVDMSKLTAEYRNWNFSFNLLLELSSKLKINKNTLVCLGATENIEYKDVLSGTYIPGEPDFKDNTITYRIVNYIQLLITEYNNLRLYSTLMTPSEELNALFINSNMQKMHYNLLATLPSITNGFFEALSYFKKNKSPKQILMFCLESFISRCLAIYNLTVTGPSAEYIKAAGDLLKKFVAYLVKKVCKFDEMLTKPGIINWNVFKDTQTGQLEEVTDANKYDSNFDENFGEQSKEDFKETKETENENDNDFNDTNKVLANQFDIDLEDGQTMDDFDNDMDLETEGLGED